MKSPHLRHWVLACVALVVTTVAAGATKRPNILLIVSDDHSVPYLGPYGASWLQTPNFDRFAAEGVRFDRMFTAAPHCVPSRAALLTGRSPVAIRMGRFHTPMPADVVTLPEVLRGLGYRTGISGRYFHLDGVNRATELSAEIYERHDRRTWHRRVDFIDISHQSRTLAMLERFLAETPDEKPWFFWMNYNDPHHPWDEGVGNVDSAKIPWPSFWPDLPELREDVRKHAGEVERMDGLFGDALEFLRKRGLDKDTLVVFIGDNGLPFPRGKGSLYDFGVHVPFLMRWPGVFVPQTRGELISGEDLTPTLIEAAGGEVPAFMSGRSFLPLLFARPYEPRKHVFAARIHHGMPMAPERTAAQFDLGRMVRTERWKLIYNCTPHMPYAPIDSWREPGWDAVVAAHRDGRLGANFERLYFTLPRPILELYDLVNDPEELENLAGRPEFAAIEAELKTIMTEKMMLDFDFLPPPVRE